MKTNTLFLATVAMTAAMAVETRTWTQTEAAEFEKGKLRGLSVSTDGRVRLAPVWKELGDVSAAHLWAVATGAEGRVYAGGAEGQVTVFEKGKAKTLATLEGGAVYALAVSGKDVYAAVSPAGKVYKIDAGGKATVFATLGARYVWALVRDGGTLYAATGDPGQIVKIDASGKTSTLFEAGETHVRALAAGPNGTLIAGTEPGGVVLRVTAKGEGFVLLQTGKREVTAVVAVGDTVYAAATGARVAAAPAAPVVAPAAPAAGPAQAAAARPAQAAPPTIGVVSTGGSEIYKILADGEPRRVWTSATAVVYALGVLGGQVVAGTGNEGRIYRVDSDFVSTRLVDAGPQQVTGLVGDGQGGVVAVTANPGKLFRLGPELEKTGTIESDVLDTGLFTYWGRLRHEGSSNGGGIRLEARSGNTEHAGAHWSAWAGLSAGERIAAPAARYLMWRATLSAAADGTTPELRLVEAAYQAKNVAPVIERVEITPANYRFPGASSGLTASNTFALPAMGTARKAPAAATGTTSETGAATLTYDAGWMGARWKAVDGNGDAMVYTVEIRGAGEREWKPLKEKLKESRVSFDTAALADGRYRLRVTASDTDDNYPGQGLKATAESEEFVVDGTAPVIEGLTAKVENGRIEVRFKAVDALTALESAEVSVNGGPWVAARPTTGITDSLAHEYAPSMEKPAGTEFTIAVRVTDERQNAAVQRVVAQ